MHRTAFLLVLLAASASALAQQHGQHGRPSGPATTAWTSQPLIVAVPGGRGERAAAQFRPVGLPATDMRGGGTATPGAAASPASGAVVSVGGVAAAGRKSGSPAALESMVRLITPRSQCTVIPSVSG